MKEDILNPDIQWSTCSVAKDLTYFNLVQRCTDAEGTTWFVKPASEKTYERSGIIELFGSVVYTIVLGENYAPYNILLPHQGKFFIASRQIKGFKDFNHLDDQNFKWKYADNLRTILALSMFTGLESNGDYKNIGVIKDDNGYHATGINFQNHGILVRYLEQDIWDTQYSCPERYRFGGKLFMLMDFVPELQQMREKIPAIKEAVHKKFSQFKEYFDANGINVESELNRYMQYLQKTEECTVHNVIREDPPLLPNYKFHRYVRGAAQHEYISANSSSDPNVEFIGTVDAISCLIVAIHNPLAKTASIGHLDHHTSVKEVKRLFNGLEIASADTPLQVHFSGLLGWELTDSLAQAYAVMDYASLYYPKSTFYSSRGKIKGLAINKDGAVYEANITHLFVTYPQINYLIGSEAEQHGDAPLIEVNNDELHLCERYIFDYEPPIDFHIRKEPTCTSDYWHVI